MQEFVVAVRVDGNGTLRRVLNLRRTTINLLLGVGVVFGMTPAVLAQRCVVVDVTSLVRVVLKRLRQILLALIRLLLLRVLTLHIRQRRLLDGRLIALILDIRCALLDTAETAKKSTGKRLKWRRTRTSIHGKNAKAGLQQTLVGEFGLVLIVEPGIR